MGIKLRLKTWLAKIISNLLQEDIPKLIESNSQIEVGKESYHNGNFEIRGEGAKVSIGSYCAIGKNVKLILKNHNFNFASIQYSFYNKHFNSLPYVMNISDVSIEIGNDVWIGDNVILLPHLKIGHGCIIGAGSVVTKSVEPYTLVAGTPAKKIKMRFEKETIDMLLEIKWWNWSEKKIKENKEFFFRKFN